LRLPNLWCMITFSSINCVPVGHLWNWWRNISTCVSTSVPATCFAIVKVTLFATNRNRWWNLGSPLSTRNHAEQHAMETPVISCCNEIQDVTIGRQVDADHLLAFSRAYSSDLPGMWYNCHKCNLLWHASERAETCNML
jgi:hypothetical protein